MLSLVDDSLAMDDPRRHFIVSMVVLVSDYNPLEAGGLAPGCSGCMTRSETMWSMPLMLRGDAALSDSPCYEAPPAVYTSGFWPMERGPTMM